MDPSGRVCLVTGAAGGLGRAFCRALIAAGAKVVASDIDEKNGEKFAAELRKEFGEGTAIFVKADVTSSDSLEEAFKAAKSTFGRLDILVNNAGILQEDGWQKAVDINVKGTVHGVLLALKHMGKAAGGDPGLVVNLSSIAGLHPTPHVPIYCATKHAVAGLSRSYGAVMHLENTGVSVVALCPGAADTPLTHNSAFNYQHPYLKPYIDQILKSIPICKPEFMAEALLRVIREAKSGSVWLADDGLIEEVVYPPNLQ
ncbi:15-hydroxyprostaglandin dehydrogenase [NAD(+)]-like [Schistocerca serialis cubense]|uniref:15-hydroxyprostaglandin dehydrogenase [NAD(+)]-like n=1 Tax=Schistocerca serialis cubense TaxID=2023355 RepID=UPI00214E49A0|nr:15-hydroxyprostaglandin dehydrogenase [NAD(+)]-like [Schistocerca serialis cubense]